MRSCARAHGGCSRRRWRAEVAAYVAEHTDQLDGHGRRLVVRNGRHQARQVLTSSGAIEVVAPRVNGFTVRRQSGKLLIKPSKAALRRIRERLRTEMRALRGANAFAVVKRLNPIIRGWAAYYRTVVSSKIFQALDAYMWKLARGYPSEPTTLV